MPNLRKKNTFIYQYQYREFLVRGNLDIKSFFQEWDWHRHFKVSPKQFRQVLATCKFSVTEDECNALLAHFTEHASGDVLYA